MFRGLLSIIYKEVFHTLRDRRTLLLVLLIPGVDLLMFGYAIDLNVKNIPTVVYDLDGRRESRELLDKFKNSGYFNFIGTVGSDQEMRDYIVRGKAQVGIKIAPDYSDKLVTGKSAQLQVLIDGSDSTVAMQALNVVNAISLRESLDVLSDTLDVTRELPVDARPRVLFNPDLRTPNFMVPGLVGIVMQVVTMLMTSFAVVKEKENGTLEQLMVTPVSRLGLMLGKLLPYAVLGTVETATVLLIMRYVFDVPIAGSLMLLAGFALCFLFTALGMGLLVSTVATNQMQAVQLSVVFILPSVLLSGFVFPRESMPAIIYAIGQIIPATYFIQVLRGIILRDAGFMDLWTQGAWLLGMGLTVLVIATARFHKTLD
ncbi:MAG: ABC transporter permease [Candidatus Hydrogenedentes bacterium]|nr:ABC transporter permease [Candidatus Hydrogenedentota bacterium]